MHQYGSNFAGFVAVLLLSTSVFAADDPELTKDTYIKWRDYIKPSEREVAYRKIPWRTGLGSAIAEAHEKGKPIFLWNYNGNPLGQGCYNAIVTKDLFTDDRVRELSSEFIPVADCSWRLWAEDKYPGHDFFVKARPQGGQGMYVFTPSGKLLGREDWDPAKVSKLMQTSLEKWKDMPSEDKAATSLSNKQKPEDKFYPVGGLVLHSYVRDLPPLKEHVDPYGPKWNQDFAWFTKEEARQFLPPTIKANTKHNLPQFIGERIARFHLIDSVHGMGSPFEKQHVKTAKLIAYVVSVEKGIATVEFEGESKTEAVGKWAAKEHETELKTQKRGYSARLLGNAQYDTARQKFVAFELIACGTRWGATEFNFRKTLNESFIGTAFFLTTDDPQDRMHPVFVSNYNWQKPQKTSRKK